MTTTQVPSDDQPEAEGMATMTFGEHLDELRRRLLISLLAIVVVMGFFLLQKDAVMSFVTTPYKTMWQKRFDAWWEESFETEVLAAKDTFTQSYREDIEMIAANHDAIRSWDWESIHQGLIDIPSALQRFGFKLRPGLISITPLQDFLTFMIAAALCGFAVASPIVLHQIWRFIAAGLYKNERRAVMSYLPASIGLFVSGMLFGFFVLVPYALFFLIGMSDSDTMLTIRDYFHFLFLLTVALGLVFQLPVVMVALTRVGITTPAIYVKYWRHVILAMFVIGALLTPPDPFTQVMMAGPLVILFFVGIFFSRIVYRKRQEREQGEGGATPPATT
ncbi:MAG: twin-arginine translocase subunit TatC [Planctomycetes bacterium]|nr:twin-arginine translocase subunit TatC [Planctomycetota bacterium]